MNKALNVIAKELKSRGFEVTFALDKVRIYHYCGLDTEFTIQSFGGAICVSVSLGNAGDYASKIMKVDGEPDAAQVDKAVHYYNVIFSEALHKGTTFGTHGCQLTLYRSFRTMPMVNDVIACLFKLNADAAVFNFSMKA